LTKRIEHEVGELSGGPTRDAAIGDHGGAVDPEADALIRALLRVVWVEHKQFTSQLASYGLTVPQYITLVQLQRGEGGVPMGHLADCMRQSSATMTGIVDRLVKMQLAERRKDQSDRRVVLVVATPEGQGLVCRAHGEKCARASQVIGRVSVPERQRLTVLLNRYLEAAEA
jgi:DNA-binding MarR family transcriptional regulator